MCKIIQILENASKIEPEVKYPSTQRKMAKLQNQNSLFPKISLGYNLSPQSLDLAVHLRQALNRDQICPEGLSFCTQKP